MGTNQAAPDTMRACSVEFGMKKVLIPRGLVDNLLDQVALIKSLFLLQYLAGVVVVVFFLYAVVLLF